MRHDNVMKRWTYTRVDTILINSSMEELAIDYLN